MLSRLSSPDHLKTLPASCAQVVSSRFLMEVHVGEALLPSLAAVPLSAPRRGTLLGLGFVAAGAGASAGARG